MSEFWQTIIQLILTPTLIVGALAFVMRELFKSYLSRDIEKYKIEFQSNLESHKAKLKAEYDVRQFEFQTRFSHYHQQKAQAIQELYILLTEAEDILQIATSLSKPPPQNENENNEEEQLLNKMNNKCRDFHLCFVKNRIFLDEPTVELVRHIDDQITVAKNMYLRGVYAKDLSEDKKQERRWKANDIGSQEIPKVRKTLETQFRQLLSAEYPNYQIEEK